MLWEKSSRSLMVPSSWAVRSATRRSSSRFDSRNWRSLSRRAASVRLRASSALFALDGVADGAGGLAAHAASPLDQVILDAVAHRFEADKLHPRCWSARRWAGGAPRARARRKCPGRRYPARTNPAAAHRTAPGAGARWLPPSDSAWVNSNGQGCHSFNDSSNSPASDGLSSTSRIFTGAGGMIGGGSDESEVRSPQSEAG